MLSAQSQSLPTETPNGQTQTLNSAEIHTHVLGNVTANMSAQRVMHQTMLGIESRLRPYAQQTHVLQNTSERPSTPTAFHTWVLATKVGVRPWMRVGIAVEVFVIV